jgi:hypothetical protein
MRLVVEWPSKHNQRFYGTKSIVFRQWQLSWQRNVHTQKMHAVYAVQEPAEDLHADAPPEQCLMQVSNFADRNHSSVCSKNACLCVSLAPVTAPCYVDCSDMQKHSLCHSIRKHTTKSPMRPFNKVLLRKAVRGSVMFAWRNSYQDVSNSLFETS